MRRSNRLLWAVLSPLILLSSCRTAINPHIAPRFPAQRQVSSESDRSRTDAQTTPRNERTKSFEQVVDGAIDLRDRYREAVGNQSKFENILGLILLPAGAASAFVGGTSSHGGNDAVIALSLASAAATTAGLRLTSRDRDFLYTLGSEAISCSLEASTPFMIPEDQAAELKELNKFSNLIEAVGRCLPQLDPQAEASHETAQNVLSEAIKLRATRLHAANHLRESVERIADQVNTGVISTRASLTTLQESIRGLSGMARGFRSHDAGLGLPETQAAPTEDKRALPPIAPPPPPPSCFSGKQIEDCGSCLADMNQRARVVNAIVSTVEKTAAELDLSACGVTVPASGLRFNPNAPMQFVIGTESSETRLLSGGEPPYVVRLTAEVEGLDIDTNNLTYVTVRATGELTAAGVYALLATDTTGAANAATLAIEVKDNQPPTAIQPSSEIKKISNGPFTIQLRGSDPEKQRLTFEIVSFPDSNKGELQQGKCASTARREETVPDREDYCYTPKNPAQDEFSFRVVDGAGLASEPTTVTIAANRAPTATPVPEVKEAKTETGETEIFEIVGRDEENQTLEFEISGETNGAVEKMEKKKSSLAVKFKLEDGQNEGSFKFRVKDDFGQPSGNVEVKIKRTSP